MEIIYRLEFFRGGNEDLWMICKAQQTGDNYWGSCQQKNVSTQRWEILGNIPSTLDQD
jgi:hypothetical protein